MSPTRLAWLAWITICVVWGTTYLAIRVALETVPVLLVAGLRRMAAGVLFSRRLPSPPAAGCQGPECGPAWRSSDS